MAQDDTGDDFTYIQDIGNWDIVEEMNVQRREERENIDKEVALRAANITSEQLKTEISQIFSKIEKSTGVKRTRVSQSIRDEAYQNIRKKIRLMVTTEFDLRFLQNNANSEQLGETLASQLNPTDLLDALSSAPIFLN